MHREAATARDPVFGMSVDTDAPPGGSVAHRGQTYFFRKLSCHEKFRTTPDRYLSSLKSERGPQSGSEGTTYLCPVDTDVRSDEPGPCPR